MSTAESICVYHEPPVGRVVLSRPEKRNAMTLAMVGAIAAGVRALDADPAIGVILIEADGDHFCSGGDLAEYKGVPIDYQEAWRLLSTGHDMVTSIEESSTIVVVKVQGLAHAGGLLLSLCADLTVASTQARFRVPELRIARPDPFIPPRLIAKVGLERASWLMLTAREIDGTEAERIGLVARCVEPALLDAEVKETLDAILATDQASRAAWKPVWRREVTPFDPHKMVTFFMSQATADAAKPYVRPE
jgi:2-(1,2-epoxy-1,2-dihydrophenyl)acetyl-CoA isomerase